MAQEDPGPDYELSSKNSSRQSDDNFKRKNLIMNVLSDKMMRDRSDLTRMSRLAAQGSLEGFCLQVWHPPPPPPPTSTVYILGKGKHLGFCDLGWGGVGWGGPIRKTISTGNSIREPRAIGKKKSIWRQEKASALTSV
jgi:hypothetical protein